MAGLNVLKGQPQALALTNAGYSPATANNPTANGLSGEQCLAEAELAFPEVNTAKLVNQARTVLTKKLTKVLASDTELAKLRIGEIARLVDVTERNYSTSTDIQDGRTFADRMLFIKGVLERLGEVAPPHIDTQGLSPGDNQAQNEKATNNNTTEQG